MISPDSTVGKVTQLVKIARGLLEYHQRHGQQGHGRLHPGDLVAVDDSIVIVESTTVIEFMLISSSSL